MSLGSFSGFPAFRLADGVATLAGSRWRTRGGNVMVRIGLVERMAALAVRFLALPLAVFHAAQCKAAQVVSALLGDDLRQRKALRGPLCHGIKLQARFLREFGNRIGRAVPGDSERNSTVSLLLLAATPFAILRRVIAVVVDSVQRVSIWARPHVSNEIGKTVLPSIANSNSSAAVITPLRIIRLSAAIQHPLPNIVKRRDFLKRHSGSPAVNDSRIICHSMVKER